MSSRLFRLFPFALLTLPITAMADTTSATEMTFEGQLLNSLHEANLMEVAAGRLAMTRGASSAIKQYGADLVKDHSLADEQVTQLAAKMNVPLPSTGAPEDDGLKQLSLLSGTAFDRAFLKMMVDDHTKAISLVRSSQPRVTSAPMTALLTKLLPMLENHRDMALALSKGLQS
jgi:putative membrane protein